MGNPAYATGRRIVTPAWRPSAPEPTPRNRFPPTLHVTIPNITIPLPSLPHDRHISPTRVRFSPPSGTVPLFRKRTAASTDQPEPSHSPPHWPPQCQREALLASRTSNRNDSPGHGRSHWPPQCQREALLGRGISFRMAGSEELAPATSAPPGPASPEPHPAERYSPVPHLSDPQPAEPESAGNAPVPGHIA